MPAFQFKVLIEKICNICMQFLPFEKKIEQKDKYNRQRNTIEREIQQKEKYNRNRIGREKNRNSNRIGG